MLPMMPTLGAVDALNSVVAAVLDAPIVRAWLERWGMSTENMSPDALTAFVEAEVRKWEPLVSRAAGGPAR